MAGLPAGVYAVLPWGLCHHALDAARLWAGMRALRAADLHKAGAIAQRAKAWIAEFGPEFPGDRATGILGRSEEEQARFEGFANDAACPALNPATGLCDVYEWRPITCRVFGPPTQWCRTEDGQAWAAVSCALRARAKTRLRACEMPVSHELEERLVEEVGDAGESVVAFPLLCQHLAGQRRRSGKRVSKI